MDSELPIVEVELDSEPTALVVPETTVDSDATLLFTVDRPVESELPTVEVEVDSELIPVDSELP
ncbi:hypothetical protein, partial [Paraburkholderia kururiensis]|uniref:hypothetical protein n=1 Tax=Paraburkholderia kururiensis TaxID=984307 RepID=UPI001F3F06BD